MGTEFHFALFLEVEVEGAKFLQVGVEERVLCHLERLDLSLCSPRQPCRENPLRSEREDLALQNYGARSPFGATETGRASLVGKGQMEAVANLPSGKRGHDKHSTRYVD